VQDMQYARDMRNVFDVLTGDFTSNYVLKRQAQHLRIERSQVLTGQYIGATVAYLCR
jgi:hypothetical protein